MAKFDLESSTARARAIAAGLMLAAVCLTAQGCLTESDDGGPPPIDSGDRAILRYLVAYADLRIDSANHPALRGSERIVFDDELTGEEDDVWVLDIDEIDSESAEISLSVDFDELGGCYFEGTSNPFEGTLTGGACVIPRPDGYVYFRQTRPARYATDNLFGESTTIIEGDWQEERFGGLLIGTGTLYLRQRNDVTSPADTPAQPAAFRDPFPAEPSPCYLADLRGTGALLSGEPATCESQLEWTGDPFTVYLDESGRMAFVPLELAPEDQRIPGVSSVDGETVRAFGGDLSGAYEVYTVSPNTGVFAFDRGFFHAEDGGLASLCEIQWIGTLTECEGS